MQNAGNIEINHNLVKTHLIPLMYEMIMRL